MRYFREVVKDRPEIRVRYEEQTAAVWCYFDPKDRPRFSMQMLESVYDLQRAIIAYYHKSDLHHKMPVRYFVFASAVNGIHNYGGDLSRLIELIGRQEREELLAYARICVEIVYLSATNFDLPLTTVALVQGSALGGGFESVLANSVIMAEEHVTMGFPEIKFNMFPGMGAYTFLARNHGIKVAEEMISSGKIYTARELYEQGIVTHLVPKGTGVENLRRLMKKQSKYAHGLHALQKVQQMHKPLSYEELMQITELWVETALRVSEDDLKTMRRLVVAQNMKKINENKKRTYQDRRIGVLHSAFPLVDSNGQTVYTDRRKGDRRRGA